MQKKGLRVIGISLVMLLTITGFAVAGGAQQTSLATDEVVTFTTYNWALVKPFDPATDAIAEYIYDNFRVLFNPVRIDEVPQLRLLAAAGTLPDMFEMGTLGGTWFPIWNDFVDQGIIRSMPDTMLEKYPNVRQLYDGVPVADAQRALKGAYYGVPRPTQLEPVFQSEWVATYYRKDWMQNVGITKEPTSYEEFYEMVRRFTFNDPNKSGRNDTFGLSGPGLGVMRWAWWNGWGALGGWQWDASAGRWVLGELLERNIAPLEWLQKMYHEGILDPEFAILNPIQAIQRFASGLIGAFPRNADIFWMQRTIVQEFGGANPGVADPFDAVGVIPIMSRAGQPLIAGAHNPHDFIQFNSQTMTDPRLDRYLEFHNWMLTDEGVRMLRLGFEGKDWEYRPDGTIRRIPDATGAVPELIERYPASGMAGQISWFFDFNADPNWPHGFRPETLALSERLRSVWNPVAMKLDLRTFFVQVPKMQEYRVVVDQPWINMIQSRDPIAPQFRTWVEQELRAGARELMDQFNAEAQRLGYRG